jgi:hypothetical protein
MKRYVHVLKNLAVKLVSNIFHTIFDMRFFLQTSMDVRDGTLHVGWRGYEYQLHSGALNGLGRCMVTSAWKEKEWMVTILDHRMGVRGTGRAAEWRFVHSDGETYAFGTRDY